LGRTQLNFPAADACCYDVKVFRVNAFFHD
jgi:hypothetical protein